MTADRLRRGRRDTVLSVSRADARVLVGVRIMAAIAASLLLAGCSARWPVGVMPVANGPPRMVWACDAPITAVTLRDDDRRLWRVSGPIAIDIEQLPFGEVPAGFSEDQALTGPVPDDQRLFLDVDFVIQDDDGDGRRSSTGVEFEIDGLEVDRVHADFTEKRTLAEFIRWSAQTCGT